MHDSFEVNIERLIEVSITFFDCQGVSLLHLLDDGLVLLDRIDLCVDFL